MSLNLQGRIQPDIHRNHPGESGHDGGQKPEAPVQRAGGRKRRLVSLSPKPDKAQPGNKQGCGEMRNKRMKRNRADHELDFREQLMLKLSDLLKRKSFVKIMSRKAAKALRVGARLIKNGISRVVNGL